METGIFKRSDTSRAVITSSRVSVLRCALGGDENEPDCSRTPGAGVAYADMVGPPIRFGWPRDVASITAAYFDYYCNLADGSDRSEYCSNLAIWVTRWT